MTERLKENEREAFRLLDLLIAGKEIDEGHVAYGVAVGAYNIYEKRFEEGRTQSCALEEAKAFILNVIRAHLVKEPKDWKDFEVGDFILIEREEGEDLYIVTAVGDEHCNWYLKIKCFFGPSKGSKSTLYKLKKEELVAHMKGDVE